MKRILMCISLVFLLGLGGTSLWSQVTTASLKGFVTDQNGAGLIGATVIAKHEPSGTLYGTTTRDDGGYNLPNLRVGGPYRVEAQYLGFKQQVFEGIQLNLAQKLTLEFELQEEGVTIEGVEVVAKADPVLNNKRTGAATNIGTQELQNLPTISRSASDYTRLTPSSDGNSFAGRNDQYNNFSLDGSIFNNPFGLDAATPWWTN